MNAGRSKVFQSSPHVVLLAVNECYPGCDAYRVRLEGRVFGAHGKAYKVFKSEREAWAFFNAYDQAAAEDWWRSLAGRVAEEFTGYVMRGSGSITSVGLLHA